MAHKKTKKLSKAKESKIEEGIKKVDRVTDSIQKAMALFDIFEGDSPNPTDD